MELSVLQRLELLVANRTRSEQVSLLSGYLKQPVALNELNYLFYINLDGDNEVLIDDLSLNKHLSYDNNTFYNMVVHELSSLTRIHGVGIGTVKGSKSELSLFLSRSVGSEGLLIKESFHVAKFIEDFQTSKVSSSLEYGDLDVADEHGCYRLCYGILAFRSEE